MIGIPAVLKGFLEKQNPIPTGAMNEDYGPVLEVLGSKNHEEPAQGLELEGW